jgi:hypothetical protein
VLQKFGLPAFVSAMALEKRGCRSYYYRGIRDGERVRKEYIGAGEFAEALARADAAIKRIKQAEREAELQRVREEVEHLEALAAPVLEIDEAAEVLARAHLIAGGYRNRRGEWRRARNT